MTYYDYWFGTVYLTYALAAGISIFIVFTLFINLFEYIQFKYYSKSILKTLHKKIDDGYKNSTIYRESKK